MIVSSGTNLLHNKLKKNVRIKTWTLENALFMIQFFHVISAKLWLESSYPGLIINELFCNETTRFLNRKPYSLYFQTIMKAYRYYDINC